MKKNSNINTTDKPKAKSTGGSAEQDLRLRAELLDSANDCIYALDEYDHFVYCNETTCSTYGYTREEFLKLKIPDIIVPELHNHIPQYKKTTLESGALSFEAVNVRKDGSTFPCEVKSRVLEVEGKKYVMVVSRDITERKKIDHDMRIRADLLDNATDIIFVTDIQGNFVYANKTTINILGCSKDELLRMNINAFSTETAERNAEIKRNADSYGEYSFEVRYRRRDGSTFPAEVFSKLVQIEGTTYVLSISRDITQRKQSQEELEFQARILNSATDSIFVWDLDKKCVYVNDAGLKSSGFTRDELMGKNLKEILPQDQYNRIINKIDDDLFSRGNIVFEAYELSRSGEQIPAEVHSHIIETGDKKYCASISSNISDRKKTENELRLRAELLDSTNDSITVWDNDTGKFVYVNETACAYHGYNREEFDRLVIEDIVVTDKPGNSLPRKHRYDPGSEDIFETFHRRNDGSTFPIEIHARQIQVQGRTYVISIGRDITRRREYEKDLKMRAELLDNSSDSVFVLDLNDNFIYFNKTTCGQYGYSREELSKLKIHDLTADPGAFLHKEKTLENGEDFFESIHRRKDGTTFPVEIRGKLFEMEGSKYILSISRDLTQRKKIDLEKKEHERRLLSSMGATILALSKTVEMRDPYTSGHQLRATLLATAIATHLGYSEDKNRGLYLAGIVHDIGKIIIPAEILSKPGKLSDFEFDLIKMHPVAGYDMLKDIEFPWPIARIVAQHHERVNGSGYPQKLKDSDILPEAKILAVADVVEAIASHRPYRPAMGIDLALEEIEKNRGTLYDPAAVDACLDLFRKYNFNFEK